VVSLEASRQLLINLYGIAQACGNRVDGCDLTKFVQVFWANGSFWTTVLRAVSLSMLGANFVPRQAQVPILPNTIFPILHVFVIFSYKLCKIGKIVFGRIGHELS
jgi:hypothetical protein